MNRGAKYLGRKLFYSKVVDEHTHILTDRQTHCRPTAPHGR